MFIAIKWDLFIEISLLIILIAIIIIVFSILIVRNLRISFKDLYRSQSKFDIELRKSMNLISKVVKDDAFERYEKLIIKEISFEDKKALLDLLDITYPKIDSTDPNNKYVIETYENLQEIRRVLDSKVLSFNQKISLFPFNIYARILKLKEKSHYTHQ
ncbi:MAG: hypothetical protein WC088_04535 [Candidatus Izemoplasmatales bacterium]|jgi:hypothetical protein|nr:hypothetical protein [Candidatus Izemoplasmatales bacterium]MDD4596021.1 hypothetical protein [Candidatus Izemoplasmatales bacterium]